MNKRIMKWAGVTAAVLIGATAWAGAKSASNVAVAVGGSGGTAWGSLAGARNSPDANQYIGCSVYGYVTGGGTPRVVCTANTVAGAYGTCSSTDSVILETARNIGDESFIEFQWNPSGQCTYLRVTKFSYYEPKLP